MFGWDWFSYLVLFEWIVRVALVARVVMRKHPVPVSLAWIALVMFVPLIGLFVYLLVGENRLGTLRLKRHERASAALEQRAAVFWRGASEEFADECDPYKHIARLGTVVGGMPPMRGNALRLFSDNNKMLDAMIEDIDRAASHCHMLFYIWQETGKGVEVGEAVMRAAARGVECRVLVDAVGGLDFLRSELAERMKGAGVRVAPALAVSAFRALFERLDLRNHRKVAVFDGRVAYAGSQNINDTTYMPGGRKKVGPWIDAMVRVEGPAAKALAVVFLRDWATDTDDDLEPLAPYLPDVRVPAGGSIVHVVPSGPGAGRGSTRDALLTTIYSAREELIMTTPYFVPDDATQAALISAALRGVAVTIVIPERSDTTLTAAAARSHFLELLEAGVKIMHYRGGLLHAKTVSVDRNIGLIGSANFDMRSFWLNFEVTLFIYDSDVAGLLRMMQTEYIDRSVELFAEEWGKRPLWRRALENTAGLLGPLL